jgi:hypothetical protein
MTAIDGYYLPQLGKQGLHIGHIFINHQLHRLSCSVVD